MKLHFTHFHLTQKQKEMGVDATGRKNWLPTKYFKICSIHFNGKIEPITLHLRLLTAADDTNVSAVPVQQQSLASTQKEKLLKKLLPKEKSKSADRLKKLCAVRESKRRLMKRKAHLEDVIAELQCKMCFNSEELDLLSNIDTSNADFLKRFLNLFKKIFCIFKKICTIVTLYKS